MLPISKFSTSKILPSRSVKILKFHWSNFNIAFSTFDCWCECSQHILRLGQCSYFISHFLSQSAIELRRYFVISYKDPPIFPTQCLLTFFQTFSWSELTFWRKKMYVSEPHATAWICQFNTLVRLWWKLGIFICVSCIPCTCEFYL